MSTAVRILERLEGLAEAAGLPDGHKNPEARAVHRGYAAALADVRCVVEAVAAEGDA